MRAILFGVVVKIPDSEPMQTQPSRVIIQRPGRRPLRSSIAPSDVAVAEGERRGPVPGLEEAGVVAVEALELGGDVVAVLPGGRDHHHHRVLGRAAAEDHQLEGPVEGGRVGDALVDQGQAIGEVLAERVGGEHGLARAHPVDVAADGVDLAVVGDHPQRLRQLPARRRVGREARVDDREGAGQRHGRGGRGRTAAAAARSASPCRRSSGRTCSGRRRRHRTRARRDAGPRTGCGRMRPRRRRPRPARMNNWLICGADPRAISPAEVSSTGPGASRSGCARHR